MAESTLIDQIKELLTNKTNELQEENNLMSEKLQAIDICAFDHNMFSDSEYLDKKYFDEDKFERNIRILFGEFPLSDFIEEATDYRKLYVYNRALKDFVGELNGI